MTKYWVAAPEAGPGFSTLVLTAFRQELIQGGLRKTSLLVVHHLMLARSSQSAEPIEMPRLHVGGQTDQSPWESLKGVIWGLACFC